MNKRSFKLAAFIIVTLHALVIFYEIFNTLMPTIPSYLDRDDLGMDRSFYMNFIVQYLFSFLISILMLYLIFVKILRKEDSDQNYDEPKNALYFAIFLMFFRIFYISVLQMINPISSLIYAVFFTSVIYTALRYHNKYWLFLLILAFIEIYLTQIDFPSDISSFKASEDVLPEPITNWIQSNGYEVEVYNKPSVVCNIMVTSFGKKIKLLLMGNWKSKFSDNEFTSVLFHELGHVYHNFSLKVTGLSYILIILKYLVYFLIFKKFTKEKPYHNISTIIFLFIYLEILISPIHKGLINGYRQYHEYLADDFSIEKWNDEGLKKLMNYMLSINFYIWNYTLLFGLINFPHPAIINRLEALRNK